MGLCSAGMALPAYADRFRVLEVQQTFYEPPRQSTLLRWRASVPPWFEFTIKAWQLITHEPRSSTYRRLRTPLSDQDRADAGGFRWTPVVQRLHGSSGARHVYSDAELDQLVALVGTRATYVMFNNLDRAPDASRFAARVAR